MLRVPPALHKKISKEASAEGQSLNSFLLNKIEKTDGGAKYVGVVDQLKTQFQENLLAVLVFGSSVRGEAKATSDIDVLIVLDSSVTISRSIYSDWDNQILPKISDKYSPQFVHLPVQAEAAGSLWLEVALEGEFVFEKAPEVRRFVFLLKTLIAAGEFMRKLSHGHPYWVRNHNAK